MIHQVLNENVGVVERIAVDFRGPALKMIILWDNVLYKVYLILYQLTVFIGKSSTGISMVTLLYSYVTLFIFIVLILIDHDEVYEIDEPLQIQ